MLVVLYCYMRKFHSCEPPEQYLLFTLSADIFPCAGSGIVCGFCPYFAQTNCRRTLSVLCRLGWKRARKVCRSALVWVRFAYSLISFHIAHYVLFSHLFGMFGQSSHVMERRCSWNVCGTPIFNERKETAKICEVFMDAALVQRWSPGGKQPSSELNIEGKFSIQEFRQYEEK